jgi:hypothetical protein
VSLWNTGGLKTNCGDQEESVKLLQSLTLSFPGGAGGCQGGVFALTDGHLGEAYETDIEAVLRDTYQLKI